MKMAGRYEHGSTFHYLIGKLKCRPSHRGLLQRQWVSAENNFLGCLSRMGHLNENDPEWHSSAWSTDGWTHRQMDADLDSLLSFPLHKLGPCNTYYFITKTGHLYCIEGCSS